MKIILQPFSEQRLGDMLKTALSEQGQIWNSFQAAVAFAKRSGVAHLQNELQGFVDRGGYIRIVIGIDQYGTSIEALSDLLNIIGDKGEIWINHEPNKYITFHPKVYLFEAESSALLIVGSGNLTEGGLYTNDEASLVYELDLSSHENQILLQKVKDAVDNWCNIKLKSVKRLDEVLLSELIEADYIRSEAKSGAEDEAEVEIVDKSEKDGLSPSSIRRKNIFGQGVVRKPPKRKGKKATKKRITSVFVGEVQPFSDKPTSSQFIVTVLHGDLPTPGSSNEIRLGKGIRDVNPAFWGWPDKFNGPDEKGQYTRYIQIEFQGKKFAGYLKDFPSYKPDGTKASGDFRIGSIAPIVKSLQREGDIVILRSVDEEGVNFIAEVIPKSENLQYKSLVDNLTEYSKARSSITGTYRRYGYKNNSD